MILQGISRNDRWIHWRIRRGTREGNKLRFLWWWGHRTVSIWRLWTWTLQNQGWQIQWYDQSWKGNRDQVLYYTLTVSDKKELNNGFRYIHELVLQRHNLKMYQDYQKLISKKVKVHSVKTDAFIIDKNDINKAKYVLNFLPNIGGWRTENNKQVLPPSDYYKMKPNKIPTIPTYENERIEVKIWVWHSERLWAICSM